MTSPDRLPVRRALLSVSDKTGLIELARALAARNVELLSTGGTAKAIRDAGLAVRDVSEVTGFPEIMDGRVKTLHPKVHGGLLGRRGTDEAVMAEHGIAPIDLLVLNLYPFEQVTADPAAKFTDIVENIDIGGPAMLRAAAKNHGTEQDGVLGTQRLDRSRGEQLPRAEVVVGPERDLGALCGEPEPLLRGVQDGERRVGDLGSDTVTGDHSETVRASPCSRRRSCLRDRGGWLRHDGPPEGAE